MSEEGIPVIVIFILFLDIITWEFFQVSVEEAHLTYSTKPANTNLDHFMHFLKCNAENTKVYRI